jgi:transcriptional regulator with XRE-family HTH domain
MRKTTGTLFAVWLKKTRKAKGLTIDALAKAAGTCKGYVSGVERGKVAPPRPRVIWRLCRALGENAHDPTLRAWIDKAPDSIRYTLNERFGKELS